jgi:phenylalanyl-tRNA synthetase beta chain
VDFKKSFFYFEIDSLELFNDKKVKLIELSKYPQVQRDLAFIVPDELNFSDIEKEIKLNSGKDLIDIKLFDLFKGGDLAKNSKSLAFRITWQSKKETLDDIYIDSLVSDITNNLKKKYKVELRA